MGVYSGDSLEWGRRDGDLHISKTIKTLSLIPEMNHLVPINTVLV